VTAGPRCLQELRHRAQLLRWHGDELAHEADFRARYWRRDGERMVLIWRAGLFAPTESWFETPDVPDERLEIPDPASAVSCLCRHEPTFDWVGMTDEAVLHYLRGKEITWQNRTLDATEHAVIPNLPSTCLWTSSMRRRGITFAPSSFVSVALDAITDIR
jgi:hypothetical protein